METAELAPLGADYQAALANIKAEKGEPIPEVKSDAPKVESKESKQEVKQEASAETNKQAKTDSSKTQKDQVKPEKTEAKSVEKTAKKKSAMDAAMAEPEKEPVQEDPIAELVKSTDPNWDKARETMRKQSEEIKSFKEQLSKAGQPSPEHQERIKSLNEENTRLKEENTKLRDSVVALDVKYDPEFQSKFVQQREKLVAQTAAKIEQAGGSKQAFLEAMEMTGSKRSLAINELLESIAGYEKAGISDRLGKIDSLEEEMNETLSNSQQSFETLRRKREMTQQQQEQEMKDFKDSMFSKGQKEIQKANGLFRMAPEDAEGADEYNQGLSEDLAIARSLLESSVTPEDAVLASFKAARFDRITTQLMSERNQAMSKIEELESELAKYHGSEPGFRGNGKEVEIPEYERPIADVYSRTLASLKGR